MPPVDPAVVRARTAAIAERFYDFPACAAAVRSLLSDYADRSHRPSQKLAGSEPPNAYKTPQPVVRMLVTALRRMALVSPAATPGLLREIWAGGSREERRVAAELLGAVSLSVPEDALALVASWLPSLESGPTVEALAHYGLGPLALADPPAHLERAQRWVASPSKWTRCLALAALLPLARDPGWDDVPGALAVVAAAMDDPLPESRKAAAEALAALLARSPAEVKRFLREQAMRSGSNAHWIVRSVMLRLPPEDQATLTRLMRA